MRLTGLELHRRGDVLRAQATLVAATTRDTVWYEVDARLEPYVLTNRLDAFAVTALLVAMERGETELIVDGVVSERLFHNLTRQFVPIMRIVAPQFGDVAISPRDLDASGKPRGTGVVTGFSGGIDSFATIVDYTGSDAPPGYRLTHLAFLNVGSHDRGEAGRRRFADRWALIQGAADSLGLDLIRIDSNLSDLLTSTFERTLLPRVASAVLLLQGLFAKFLCSGSHRYRDCRLKESTDLTYADPATVHLMSTESLESVSTGCQYTRVEKTRRVLDLPATRGFLNVCVHPLPGGRNCSRCFKCLRTMATLDLLGQLDSYEKVFDLAAYRRFSRRGQYLLLLPGRRDDLYIDEIYELARTGGHTPSLVSAFHRAWPLVGWAWQGARGVRRTAHRWRGRSG